MGALITLGVGVAVLGVPFDLGAVDWPLFVDRDDPRASSSIIAIGVLLAAICLQTRQESWSYPEAVGRRAVPRQRRGLPARSSCRSVVQAIGLLTPLSWWIEGVRQALFPGGIIVDRRDRVAVRDADRTRPLRTPPRSSSPCWSPGPWLHSRLDRRLPGERPARQGPGAARPDHGILTEARRVAGRRRSRGGPMRIYEGSPRQDFEEVFRSIGAFLDQRGMHDVLLVEAPDGFIVQGLVVGRCGRRRLVGVVGRADQGDADVPRRRHRPVHGGGRSPAAASRNPTPAATPATTRRRSGSSAGTWTSRSRGTSSSSSRTARSSSACSWAARPAASTMLAEFTRDDIAEMVARGPTLRQPDPAAKTAANATPAG